MKAALRRLDSVPQVFLLTEFPRRAQTRPFAHGISLAPSSESSAGSSGCLRNSTPGPSKNDRKSSDLDGAPASGVLLRPPTFPGPSKIRRKSSDLDFSRSEAPAGLTRLTGIVTPITFPGGGAGQRVRIFRKLRLQIRKNRKLCRRVPVTVLQIYLA